MIVPGLTLCSRCHARDAELTLEPHERWAEELCFDCLELMLERENATHTNRPGADLLAVAAGEINLRELELRDTGAEAGRLLERLSTPAAAQAAARCWAILPSGERCKRKATAGRYALVLCDTHRHGARIPGLGWSHDGKPQGRILEAAA